jgi:hypothetical protein
VQQPWLVLGGAGGFSAPQGVGHAQKTPQTNPPEHTFISEGYFALSRDGVSLWDLPGIQLSMWYWWPLMGTSLMVTPLQSKVSNVSGHFIRPLWVGRAAALQNHGPFSSEDATS